MSQQTYEQYLAAQQGNEPTTPTDPPADSTTSAPTASTAAPAKRNAGDVVQYTVTDPITGGTFAGHGQVVDVLDADDDNPVRYVVARLDVLGVPVTDDDLVDSES